MKISMPTLPGKYGALSFSHMTTDSYMVGTGLAPALDIPPGIEVRLAPALDTTILLILETFNLTPKS